MDPTSTSHSLELPLIALNSQREGLLVKVCEQGGFAYAGLVLQAAAGDPQAAEAAHEMAWEQLHSAPWHSVHPVWRDAFSLACLHMASFRHYAGKSVEALRFLDMGLIMGGSLLRLDLDSAVSFLQLSASTVDSAGADLTEPGFGTAKSINMPDELNVLVKEGSFIHGNFESKGINRFRLSEHSVLWTKYGVNGETVGSGFKLTKFSKFPSGSLGSTLVQKRSILPLEDFLCDFFLSSKPVIVTDAMVDWPALKKWKNLEYLQKAVGNRTVPVEVGEHYLTSGWRQELMTVSELLERLQCPDSSPATRVYLAQHPLFEQIPQLREDILIPDYCAVSGGEIHSINAWLGPVGTVTPLHHDPHHNLLAQVVGQKYVRLYSSNFSECLYPYSEPMLSNSSQLDLDHPDYDKFPLAKDLPFMDCILGEGQMLYIPPKWWHYVRSLSPSFSVSFWWNISRDM